MKYVTIQGDTWDNIAYKVAGNVYAMSDIMRANKQYLGTLIFNGGIELDIPDNINDSNFIKVSSPWE